MPQPETPIDSRQLYERTLSAHDGVDVETTPWLLGESTLAYAENLELDSMGKRSRRRGTASIGVVSGVTTIVSPVGLWPWFSSTYDRDVLMGAYDGGLFTFPAGGIVTQLGCGVSLVQQAHMAVQGYTDVNTRCVYVSSAAAHDSNASLLTNLLRVDLDGGFTQVASMAPLGIMWWQRRLWAWGNMHDIDDEALWWSSLNDGLAYSAINTVQVEPGVGGRLTAAAPLRSGSNTVLLFKERLTALFDIYWGSSSALIPQAADALDTIKSSIRVVTNDYGCVATKSLQPTGGSEVGDFLFLAHDGVRALVRASDDTVIGASLPISKPIQPDIDRINFNFAHKACATVWENKYFLAVPLDGATKNTHILVFDLIKQRWIGTYTWTVADLTTTNMNETQDVLWIQYNTLRSDTTFTTADLGYHVYRSHTGNIDPNGVTADFREESRAYTFGTLDHKKRWEWLSVHAYNQTATAVIGVDVKVNNDKWVNVGNVTFPPVGGTIVIIGSSRLVWSGLPNGVNSAKLSLADVTPGYMLQTRLTSTSPTDYSVPYFVQTNVAASIIDPEFDNRIT